MYMYVCVSVSHQDRLDDMKCYYSYLCVAVIALIGQNALFCGDFWLIRVTDKWLMATWPGMCATFLFLYINKVTSNVLLPFFIPDVDHKSVTCGIIFTAGHILPRYFRMGSSTMKVFFDKLPPICLHFKPESHHAITYISDWKLPLYIFCVYRFSVLAHRQMYIWFLAKHIDKHIS